MTSKKAGFVAIIGRPNVGKSTLLNLLVGEKLAGVSAKPQTTRAPIRGILSRPEGQIVFVDTPGYHDPRDPLGNWMMREIKKSLEEVDVVYWLVTPGKSHPYDQKVLRVVRELKAPVFLLINQIDRFPKPSILPVISKFQHEEKIREFIPISAKMNKQVDVVIEKTLEYLPEGEPLYPEDQISDQSERFIVCEFLREKLYRLTGQEIPYSTAVEIEKFDEGKEKITEIHAIIYVERDSQKQVVIGKDGAKLKQIGQEARFDIETFLGKKVFLKLWVKTRTDWKHSKSGLKNMGYE